MPIARLEKCANWIDQTLYMTSSMMFSQHKLHNRVLHSNLSNSKQHLKKASRDSEMRRCLMQHQLKIRCVVKLPLMNGKTVGFFYKFFDWSRAELYCSPYVPVKDKEKYMVT